MTLELLVQMCNQPIAKPPGTVVPIARMYTLIAEGRAQNRRALYSTWLSLINKVYFKQIRNAHYVNIVK